jgi:DNA-binding transcriptional ArsR family regulator
LIIPEEVKDTVSALDNDVRWRIVELVHENQNLSYTELLQRLWVRKGSLTHHLNRLMEAGILDNYSGENFGGSYTSYYKLSRYGRDFVAGLLSSVKVNLPFHRVASTDMMTLMKIKTCARRQNDYLISNFLQPRTVATRDYEYEDVEFETTDKPSERYLLSIKDIQKRLRIAQIRGS